MNIFGKSKVPESIYMSIFGLEGLLIGRKGLCINELSYFAKVLTRL